MKIIGLVYILLASMLSPTAYANYGVRYMRFGNFLYYTDGYWQIIHQEAIVDADGFQFIHIEETSDRKEKTKNFLDIDRNFKVDP